MQPECHTIVMYYTERNETDILRDIISDMQEEIDQLKLFSAKRTGIAIWKSTGSVNGPMLSVLCMKLCD